MLTLSKLEKSDKLRDLLSATGASAKVLVCSLLLWLA